MPFHTVQHKQTPGTVVRISSLPFWASGDICKQLGNVQPHTDKHPQAARSGTALPISFSATHHPDPGHSGAGQQSQTRQSRPQRGLMRWPTSPVTGSVKKTNPSWIRLFSSRLTLTAWAYLQGDLRPVSAPAEMRLGEKAMDLSPERSPSRLLADTEPRMSGTDISWPSDPHWR